MHADVPSRVRDEAVRQGAGAGVSVLAMVSGGADSMCLMHCLAAAAPGRVGVVSVDHGLRPDAALEAAAVCEAAAGLGVPAWAVRVDVAAGPGVQERARTARYAAAREVAAREGYALLATGHTADDQAETVLFRIARGTGRTGALGIGARDGVVRPLLGVTRARARAWCVANRVPFTDDPSNDDPAYARTRVRHELLPLLERVHPGAAGAVVRFAQTLADEAALIAPMVADADARCAVGDGVAAGALAREPAPLARLVLREVAGRAGVHVDAAAVERLRRLAAAGAGRIDLPGGAIGAVDRGILRICAPPPPSPAEVRLEVPGRVRFGDATVVARPVRAGPPAAGRADLVLAGTVGVRAPRPGDRIALAGGGRTSVARVLAQAGVPAWRRHLVPVVHVGGRVVWVGGYRADPHLLAPAGARATRLELV